jgi:antitoxin VapB
MMTAKTASLFVNGGSQAVRLPAAFRFEGVSEVFIRRDAVTGDVVLSASPTSHAWRDFFSLRDSAELPTDFAKHRPLNEPLQPRAAPPRSLPRQPTRGG